MGISSDWPRIFAGENANSNFATPDAVPNNIRSVFIDGQIRLMQSFVKQGISWREFVDYMFISHIQKQHLKYDTVVLAFDNYDSVPLYKSIEQQRRSSVNKKIFKFETGEELPAKPPPQDIWVLALQNRIFKKTVISIICNLIASNYKPKNNHKTLIIDFINVIRIEYTIINGTVTLKRDTVQNMAAMGESDVKFMRYTDMIGNMVVDSIDSDVLLISMLYAQVDNFRKKVYIRRYKVNDPQKDVAIENGKRKRTVKKKEYEIIDVNQMTKTLHDCVREAVGNEITIEPGKMTYMLVFIFLLAGVNVFPFCILQSRISFSNI